MFIEKVIPQHLRKYFTQGHERSVNVKKNILASFFIKGLSILIQLMLVPLCLNYLDKEGYGIWLTITSIIGWISIFDIGMGNGLRNKFAEALAKNKKKLARIYVSTTYFYLFLIGIIIFLIFLVINPLLNWATILNTSSNYEIELSHLALLTVGLFCIRFVVQLINVILIADQRPSFSSFLNLIGNVFALIAIYLLTINTKNSLIYISIALSGLPSLILLISSMILFNKTYRNYVPSVKLINSHFAKDLIGIGLRFFVLHVTVLIINFSNNFIIAQLFGPSEVTPYNIANKYFGISAMVMSIILSPFWSAFTEAYFKNDIQWIKRTIRTLFKTWTLITIGIFLMTIISGIVFKLWIGNKVKIAYTLSIILAFYYVVLNWNSILGTMVNGVGKINLQLYLSIIIAIINIPICILFAKTLDMGLNGIVLGNLISLIPGSILIFIQVRLIIEKKEYGIWSK